MSAPRKIIHLDLDAFYCAVEEQHDSSLAGKPFAVGGRPEERGVVSSCSYPARRKGVHSAMPMAVALRVCPALRIIPPRHDVYSQMSQKVMEQLQALTPLVEQISIDEAFLDVTDLPDDPGEIARNLQSTIHKQLRLPCSLGVASNKLVAKIATDVGKHAVHGDLPPNAITVVPPGKEAEFLAPLPVQALWGVGPKSAEKLAALGILTIADLARCPVSELVRIFGKTGHEFSLHAQGIDDRPLITYHEPKSISQEITYARDIVDPEKIHNTLRELCEGVGEKLRQEERSGTTIKLKLRWSDFTTLTRQVTLPIPTDQDQEILHAAQELFNKTWKPGQFVRLIGVGISGLVQPVRQLSLWDAASTADSDKNRQLQAALDDLRQRFGKEILQRGSKLKPPK